MTSIGDLSEKPTNRFLLRGYAPLAVIGALFLLMSFLAPTVAPAEDVTIMSGGVDGGVFGGNNTFLDSSGSGSSSGQVTGGSSAGGAGGGGTGSATGGATGGGAATGGTPPAQGSAIAGSDGSGIFTPPGATLCADRVEQRPGDPYSPPCYVFKGDNGGATTRGVSASEIIATVRLLDGPSAAEIFASISGAEINDSPGALRDTYIALADYFNENFQFYGRKLRMEVFTGQGNAAEELLGGGKEKARADALAVSKEKKAFAEVAAATIPFADALSQQDVVNFGAPYPSRAWFIERQPYAWSLFNDGTDVVESSMEALLKRMRGRPAEYAGDGLQGKDRVFAIVAPENAEYQESVAEFIKLAEANGVPIKRNIKYKLDLNTMPNQASSIIAQLKNDGVTTVLAATDPVMLAIGLAPKANEQGYFPEWSTAGLAFVDQDIVSQLVDERQWRHAFGIAYNAESEPFGQSLGYNAFKSVRPNAEPAFGVEVLYYQMYMLALGVHMAGPNLTPETFAQGMFAYPGGSGPVGTWGFKPGNYTPTDDFREIWWDPERTSPQNNEKGSWVQLNNGRRYLEGQLPSGPAPFFE